MRLFLHYKKRRLFLSAILILSIVLTILYFRIVDHQNTSNVKAKGNAYSYDVSTIAFDSNLTVIYEDQAVVNKDTGVTYKNKRGVLIECERTGCNIDDFPSDKEKRFLQYSGQQAIGQSITPTTFVNMAPSPSGTGKKRIGKIFEKLSITPTPSPTILAASPTLIITPTLYIPATGPTIAPGPSLSPTAKAVSNSCNLSQIECEAPNEAVKIYEAAISSNVVKYYSDSTCHNRIGDMANPKNKRSYCETAPREITLRAHVNIGDNVKFTDSTSLYPDPWLVFSYDVILSNVVKKKASFATGVHVYEVKSEVGSADRKIKVEFKYRTDERSPLCPEPPIIYALFKQLPPEFCFIEKVIAGNNEYISIPRGRDPIVDFYINIL